MELNATFGTLLRSIGYTLYHAGARVNASQDGQAFGPFDHMLNILTIGSDRYLVDVGFGSNYVPIVPVRLINDTSGFTNVAPASARLVFKAIEGAANPYHKLWVYQHRVNPDRGWKDMYCFHAELEFRKEDFEMMNHWTSTSPRTIFTQKVICNKMIAEDGEIVGTLGLMRELKRRVGRLRRWRWPKAQQWISKHLLHSMSFFSQGQALDQISFQAGRVKGRNYSEGNNYF